MEYIYHYNVSTSVMCQLYRCACVSDLKVSTKVSHYLSGCYLSYRRPRRRWSLVRTIDSLTSLFPALSLSLPCLWHSSQKSTVCFLPLPRSFPFVSLRARLSSHFFLVSYIYMGAKAKAVEYKLATILWKRLCIVYHIRHCRQWGGVKYTLGGANNDMRQSVHNGKHIEGEQRVNMLSKCERHHHVDGRVHHGTWQPGSNCMTRSYMFQQSYRNLIRQ